LSIKQRRYAATVLDNKATEVARGIINDKKSLKDLMAFDKFNFGQCLNGIGKPNQ
jgi:hypothetical protein